jgi:tetratricopeptide (TPR) repeat protein
MSCWAVALPAWAQEAEREVPPEAPEAASADDRTVDPPAEDPTARDTAANYVEEARLLFLAGDRAFEAGRYESALSSFQRAHEITGDTALLYNIAVTADRLRRDDVALEAFESYLAAVPTSPDAPMIRSRIRILREQIAERERPTQPSVPATPPRLLSSQTETERDDDGGFFSQWWVWAIAGVLVAGGVVTAVLVSGGEQDPSPGSEGIVLEVP